MTEPVETVAESDTADSAAAAELIDATAPPEDYPPPPMVPVHEAFAALQRDLRFIAKTERNQDKEYDFRSFDAVLDAVGPVQRRHGVFFIPKVLRWKTERFRNTRGVGVKGAEVEVGFTIIGPMGDRIDGGSAVGDATDEGDQALSAAQSVAFKVFLLTASTMPTGLPDPAGNNHERASRSDDADAARAEMVDLFRDHAADKDDLADMVARAVQEFAQRHGGIDIRDCLDPEAIQKLTAEYREHLSAPA